MIKLMTPLLLSMVEKPVPFALRALTAPVVTVSTTPACAWIQGANVYEAKRPVCSVGSIE